MEVEFFGRLYWPVLWADQALTEVDGFEIFNADATDETKNLLFRQNFSFDFVRTIPLLSASAERPLGNARFIEWFLALNPSLITYFQWVTRKNYWFYIV